jgi:hypothetical protein
MMVGVFFFENKKVEMQTASHSFQSLLSLKKQTHTVYDIWMGDEVLVVEQALFSW